jgi:hypothetical protein
MKRLVLFVVALVFAFSTTVMAADKPAAPAAAEPAKVEKTADEKKMEKKEAKKAKKAIKKEKREKRKDAIEGKFEKNEAKPDSDPTKVKANP